MADTIVKTSVLSYPGQHARGTTFFPGSSETPYGSSPSAEALTSTFVGSKNPRWRQQLRNVTSATTTASGTVRSADGGQISGQIEWWGQASAVGNRSHSTYRRNTLTSMAFGESEGNSTVPAPTIPSWLTADNRAIEDLYDSINSIESSASAGEDLGEIGQTVRMLKSPLRDLRRAVTDWVEPWQHQRKKNDRLAREGYRDIIEYVNDNVKDVKVIANTVLEYNLGIKPLCNSIADALVGLQNRDHLAVYYPVYARGQANNETSGTFNKGMGNRSLTVGVNHTRTLSVQYSGVYGITANTDQRSVRDVLRLRLRDTVPTLWNLLPNSWLFDYCANVGTLAEQFAVNWNGMRWCNKTTRDSNTRVFTPGQPVVISNCFGQSVTISPVSHTRSTVSFTRVKQIDMPRPTLEIDLNLSGKRIANVASLAVSRLPFLKKKLQKVIDKNPGLESAFADEVGRRGLRIPYPFHKP